MSKTFYWVLIVLFAVIVIGVAISALLYDPSLQRILEGVLSGLIGGFIVAMVGGSLFDKHESSRIKENWKLTERLEIKMRALDYTVKLGALVHDGRKDISHTTCDQALSFIETVWKLYKDQGDIGDSPEVGVIPELGKKALERILKRDYKSTGKFDCGDLKCLRGDLQEFTDTLDFE